MIHTRLRIIYGRWLITIAYLPPFLQPLGFITNLYSKYRSNLQRVTLHPPHSSIQIQFRFSQQPYIVYCYHISSHSNLNEATESFESCILIMDPNSSKSRLKITRGSSLITSMHWGQSMISALPAATCKIHRRSHSSIQRP